MNGLMCSGGSVPFKATVTAEGTKLFSNKPNMRYVRISNLSSSYVSLAPKYAGTADNCPVEFGEGIVLAPKGTPGWFIEFNNNNMFYSDYWAITESGNADIAVLIGI